MVRFYNQWNYWFYVHPSECWPLPKKSINLLTFFASDVYSVVRFRHVDFFSVLSFLICWFDPVPWTSLNRRGSSIEYASLYSFVPSLTTTKKCRGRRGQWVRFFMKKLIIGRVRIRKRWKKGFGRPKKTTDPDPHPWPRQAYFNFPDL